MHELTCHKYLPIVIRKLSMVLHSNNSANTSRLIKTEFPPLPFLLSTLLIVKNLLQHLFSSPVCHSLSSIKFFQSVCFYL